MSLASDKPGSLYLVLKYALRVLQLPAAVQHGILA